MLLTWVEGHCFNSLFCRSIFGWNDICDGFLHGTSNQLHHHDGFCFSHVVCNLHIHVMSRDKCMQGNLRLARFPGIASDYSVSSFLMTYSSALVTLAFPGLLPYLVHISYSCRSNRWLVRHIDVSDDIIRPICSKYHVWDQSRWALGWLFFQLFNCLFLVFHAWHYKWTEQWMTT